MKTLPMMATRRLWAQRVAIGLLGAAAGELDAQESEQPTIRTSVNFLLLDVGVIGKDGKPVTGLGKERFEVRDNGRKQSIVSFESGDTAGSYALVIDYSRSMRHRKTTVLAAVRHFAARLNPEDELAVVTFNDGPRVTQPLMVTANLKLDWQEHLMDVRAEGRTAMRDAILTASDLLAHSRHTRRVAIILSDGEDTASQTTKPEFFTKLRSADMTMFAICMFAPGEPDTDPGALEDITRETGGRMAFAEVTTKLAGAFDRILSDLRTRYVIGVQPGDGQAKGLHHLKVVVHDAAGRELGTRARRSYVSGGEK